MPKRKIKKEPFENWTCKIILKKVYNENFSWDELSEYFDKDPDYLYRILKEFFAKRGIMTTNLLYS